jgi:hypothetical protein
MLPPTSVPSRLPERVRDEGGHALVVVDDLRPLSDAWEALLEALAGGCGVRVTACVTRSERYPWKRMFGK